MKKRSLLLFTFMFIAGITVCMANKIDGKWKTTMGEDMELTFTFKVVGDSVVTGTVSSQMGDMPIVKGKIKGDQFTFGVDMDGNPINHICKMEGDVIKMKIKMNGMGDDNNPGEMILKKVEAK
jgi:hypothetical protein